MTTNLVDAIIYNCFMNELLVRRYINVTIKPIQLRHPTLWRHKAPFFIYKFYDSFLRRCKEILTGEVPTPVIKEARDFLRGKGKLYIEEENTYFQMYGFKGMPFLLPRFVTNWIFASEFCHRYLDWSSFFKQKHKKKFIQTPFFWVANVCVKILLHLREVEKEFETREFFKGFAVGGFDLAGIFMSHWNFVDYTNIYEIFVP